MVNEQRSTSKDRDAVVEALLSTMDPNRRDSWQRVLELDHLVPLELGGAPRDPANLWLQRWDEARKKDELEASLRKAVCGGHLTLEQAQERIRLKWGPKP